MRYFSQSLYSTSKPISCAMDLHCDDESRHAHEEEKKHQPTNQQKVYLCNAYKILAVCNVIYLFPWFRVCNRHSRKKKSCPKEKKNHFKMCPKNVRWNQTTNFSLTIVLIICWVNFYSGNISLLNWSLWRESERASEKKEFITKNKKKIKHIKCFC